ncbi:hypothetical protein [Sphingomonas sp. Y38-1Y]|uniref:hypothetical protein n=1 Tax=Sphingomonas sp. Y38-1Y TaxID=3078265 RepID=UPI0028E34C2D|nr:hypothetical protein [Sphingomonas sp. Y38-1Y]
MHSASPCTIDLGSRDRDAALIHRDADLVAVAVRLADPGHGEHVGRWHLEAYFPAPGARFPLFDSLDGVVDHLCRVDAARRPVDARNEASEFVPELSSPARA